MDVQVAVVPLTHACCLGSSLCLGQWACDGYSITQDAKPKTWLRK